MWAGPFPLDGSREVGFVVPCYAKAWAVCLRHNSPQPLNLTIGDEDEGAHGTLAHAGAPPSEPHRRAIPTIFGGKFSDMLLYAGIVRAARNFQGLGGTCAGRSRAAIASWQHGPDEVEEIMAYTVTCVLARLTALRFPYTLMG